MTAAVFETKEAAQEAAIKEYGVLASVISPGVFWIGPSHAGVYKVPSAGWYVKSGKSFLAND